MHPGMQVGTEQLTPPCATCVAPHLCPALGSMLYLCFFLSETNPHGLTWFSTEKEVGCREVVCLPYTSDLLVRCMFRFISFLFFFQDFIYWRESKDARVDGVGGRQTEKLTPP